MSIEIIPIFCFSLCSPTLCAFFVKLCESISRRRRNAISNFFRTVESPHSWHRLARFGPVLVVCTWWNPRQAWPCCTSLFLHGRNYSIFFGFPCCTLFSCGMLGHKGTTVFAGIFVAVIARYLRLHFLSTFVLLSSGRCKKWVARLGWCWRGTRKYLPRF